MRAAVRRDAGQQVLGGVRRRMHLLVTDAGGARLARCLR